MDRYVRGIRPLTVNLATAAAVLSSAGVVMAQTLSPAQVEAAKTVSKLDPTTLMALIALASISLAGYVYKTAIHKLDRITTVMSGLECVQQRERRIAEANKVLGG